MISTVSKYIRLLPVCLSGKIAAASTSIQAATPEDAKSRFTRNYDANAGKRKVDNATASATAVKEELSEYELQRQLNIERNNARLQVRK